MVSVLAHYGRLFPKIEEIVAEHADDEEKQPFVLEGSALVPANVVTLGNPRVSAVWLTATDDVFQERIYNESQYRHADAVGKRLIDSFLDRTIEFKRLMITELKRLDLPWVTVDFEMTVNDVVQRCLLGLHRA